MFIVDFLHFIFSDRWLLLLAVSASCFVKIYLLCVLIPHGLRVRFMHKQWLFLIGTIAGALFADLSWMAMLLNLIYRPHFPYQVAVFGFRISWAMVIVQYQSLILFIESLTAKKMRLHWLHKILLGTSSIFIGYFLYAAFFENTLCTYQERIDACHADNPPFEIIMMRHVATYVMSCMMAPSVILAVYKLRTAQLPKILHKQLKIFFYFFMMPYIATESVVAILTYTTLLDTTTKNAAQILSTVLITYALYYCIRRIMGVRFLNVHSHVHRPYKTSFIDTFKVMLGQLSHAARFEELQQVTQSFFKNAFEVPLRKTTLCIRAHTNQHDALVPTCEPIVESFLSAHESDVCAFVKNTKILIYDEIAFNNFYESTPLRNTIIQFLDAIDADIFLPVYSKDKVVAYVIVERHARWQELYGSIERDQMIVFANYLGNVINLIQHKNLEMLMHQEKELKEELHRKHQEIDQYKESIRSFMRSSHKKEIGILFYKNNRFVFGNESAKSLIDVNINILHGHPLTQALKKVATRVRDYKAPYTTFAQNDAGTKLILSGVMNLERNNVIITAHYPELSDIIRRNIDLLKDPTRWDYLLYLETTKSGQLINQLIPGNGERLLNFKINLLKIALSQKATLLEQMPEQDVTPFVELLHHISLRETLHTLELTAPSTDQAMAIELFGINPLLHTTGTEQPLLARLDRTGTLFINNIHFLNLETQEYLAEFIKYGMYRTFKSDQRNASSVRIIAATDQNLRTLVQAGTFCKNLFNELSKSSLSMPSLTDLSALELSKLADGFSEQAIKAHDLKKLLALTDKDKRRLAQRPPLSLHELKQKVQSLLVEKSKKNNIYEEAQFDPAYNVTDPELMEAARLGKYALRDQALMMLLWNKFKNQNKIAAFLGVNRSSVNRRGKEYNLF